MRTTTHTALGVAIFVGAISLILDPAARITGADRSDGLIADREKLAITGADGDGGGDCPFQERVIPCTSTTWDDDANECSKRSSSGAGCGGATGGCDEFCASTQLTHVCTSGANLSGCRPAGAYGECGYKKQGGTCYDNNGQCTCTGGSFAGGSCGSQHSKTLITACPDPN